MAELSQLPDIVNIKFVAGDTFRIRVRVLNPDDSTAMTLADYSFAAWIARPDRTSVADFDIVPDPDADPPDTSIILTLPPDETAALISLGTGTEFTGMWDLEVIFPSGDVRTVAKGSVTCYDDITHSGTAPAP